MKIPGPDHPITIEPNGRRVRVTFNGRVVADTTRALTLRETTLRPVHYIPREDVDMSLFVRTARTTHCPYKVWTYEAPFPAMASIKERLAFYPDRVDRIEETAA